MTTIYRGARDGESSNIISVLKKVPLHEQHLELQQEYPNLKSNESERISNEARKPSRKVRFFNRVQMRVIRDYRTSEHVEAEKLWLTDIDYERIRSQLHYVVEMLNQGGESVQNHLPGFCARGLECRTKGGVQRRKIYRRKAYKTVFREQDRQWKTGRFDDRRLATLYANVAKSAHQDAYSMGVRDEAESRKEMTEWITNSSSGNSANTTNLVQSFLSLSVASGKNDKSLLSRETAGHPQDVSPRIRPLRNSSIATATSPSVVQRKGSVSRHC